MALVATLCATSCQKASVSQSAVPGGGGGGDKGAPLPGSNSDLDTEIEVSGSIRDDEPTQFVQASDSISIAGTNLTNAGNAHIVSVFMIDPKGSKRLIYKSKFPGKVFYFKTNVRKGFYLTLLIERES
ncbi:MAG: hypothetical protein EBX50_19305, partial [Chitinophagia bacterium]|nr:hypothetical protein [Chitinophagia bacterium]